MYSKDKCYFCNVELTYDLEDPAVHYCKHCKFNYSVLSFEPDSINNYDIRFNIDETYFTFTYDSASLDPNKMKRMSISIDQSTIYEIDCHLMVTVDNYKEIVEKVKKLLVLK